MIKLCILAFAFVKASSIFLNSALLSHGSQTFQNQVAELPLRSQRRELVLKLSSNLSFSMCENHIMDVGS